MQRYSRGNASSFSWTKKQRFAGHRHKVYPGRTFRLRFWIRKGIGTNSNIQNNKFDINNQNTLRSIGKKKGEDHSPFPCLDSNLPRSKKVDCVTKAINGKILNVRDTESLHCRKPNL